MLYEKLKKLSSANFKRYCGVERETFDKMCEIVRYKSSVQRLLDGRPPKLSIGDQVLLTLEYWREYRTYFHIAKSWNLAESNVSRTIRRVEDVLSQSKAFPLPGKKKLQAADHEIAFIVVDVAETPVERPKKSKDAITVARKSVIRSSRKS